MRDELAQAARREGKVWIYAAILAGIVFTISTAGDLIVDARAENIEVSE